MTEYHKIQTVFKRNPETKFRTLLMWQWSVPEFGYLAENLWTWTEKVDGTNIRIMIDTEGRVTFGGKTDKATIQPQLEPALSQMFLNHGPEKLRDFFPTGACLYGEGYGPKIQKGGGNYRDDASFVLFDVNIEGHWLQRADVNDVAEKLSVDASPVLGLGTLTQMTDFVREGFDSRWGDFKAEGVVARPVVELKTGRGSRIITKLKHKDFVD